MIRNVGSRDSIKEWKNMAKECLPGPLCPFQAREPRVLASYRQFWKGLSFFIFPLNSFASVKIETFYLGTWSSSMSQGQRLHWCVHHGPLGGSLLANDMFVINSLVSKSITFLHKIKKISPIVYGNWVCSGQVFWCMFLRQSDTY